MEEEAIEILTKMVIEEHIKNRDKDEIIKITKKDLIRFCIKLLKIVEKSKIN